MYKVKNIKHLTNWIAKNSTSDIETEKAILMLQKSIYVYKIDKNKDRLIKFVQDKLRNEDLFAEHYVLSAKAFLKYTKSEI